MQPINRRELIAARSTKPTSVPIASGMPRSARSRRTRSSGASSPNFWWTNQASHSQVIFERAYGAGSDAGVVRSKHVRHRQVVRRTTRRRWCSLTTWSFSSTTSSTTSSALEPQWSQVDGRSVCYSASRCLGTGLRPGRRCAFFGALIFSGSGGGLGRASNALCCSAVTTGD